MPRRRPSLTGTRVRRSGFATAQLYVCRCALPADGVGRAAVQAQEELSLPHRTRTGLRCQRQPGKFAVTSQSSRTSSGNATSAVCSSARAIASMPASAARKACSTDRAVPTEYPAGPPWRMIASRTTAARPAIPRSPDDVATLAWTGDPLCVKEVVSRSTPRTREPRRSAVCEALCRTRTGDPFLTMAVPPSRRILQTDKTAVQRRIASPWQPVATGTFRHVRYPLGTRALDWVPRTRRRRRHRGRSPARAAPDRSALSDRPRMSCWTSRFRRDQQPSLPGRLRSSRAERGETPYALSCSARSRP